MRPEQMGMKMKKGYAGLAILIKKERIGDIMQIARYSRR